MNIDLTLVEATVYDNITEQNGRGEVLDALRSQRDIIARVEAMLKSYKRQLPVRGSVQTSEVIADLEVVLMSAPEKEEKKESERPDKMCGTCGDRLIWENNHYTHAGPVLERHGAWPVEEWEDDED